MQNKQKENHHFNRMNRFISNRLASLILAIVIFFISSQLVTTYVNFSQYVQKTSMEHFSQLIQSYISLLENDFDDLFSLANATSLEFQMLNHSADENIEQFMHIQEYNFITHPYIHSSQVIYNIKGQSNVLFTYREQNNIFTKEDPEFLQTDFYTSIQHTTEAYFTPVYNWDNQNIISFILPVKNESSEASGIIVFNLTEKHFNVLLEKLRPSNCDIFIVDNFYNVFAQTNTTQELEHFLPTHQEIIAENIMNGNPAMEYVKSPNGKGNSLMIAYPLPWYSSSNGSLIILIPNAYLMERLHITNYILVISLSILVILIAGFILYSKQVSKRLYTDVLTKAYNRQYMDKKLPTALSRNYYKKKILAVIMCDIDHFKAVNDTYGHQAGDEILKHFYNTLKISLKGRGWITRYGGEEFLVCLPDIDQKKIPVIAENLRSSIEESSCQNGDSIIKITASFGVSIADSIEFVSMIDVIKKADANLYQAKESGRNRVIL